MLLLLCLLQGAFESGSRDVFSLTTNDLGALKTMTLGHNGKGMGAAWQVDTAEIENVDTGVQCAACCGMCFATCCLTCCGQQVRCKKL